MTSTKTLARIAGLLYLLVAVTSGIAGAARGAIVVAGDSAATAAHVRASESLFRVGVVADLAQAVCFMLTAMALYALLQNVNRLAAAAMVTFVAVSAAIQSLNLLNEVAALTIATDRGYASALGQGGSDALTGLFVGLQQEGFIIAQVFFGLWLLPLGYLVVRTGFFPRLLGYLLAIACFAYLADVVAHFLAPVAEPTVLPFVAAIGALAELLFAVWLLVKPPNTPLRDARASATPAATAVHA